MAYSAYVADYAGADLGPIIIDLVATVFVGFVTLGTPIALVLMYRWLKGRSIGL